MEPIFSLDATTSRAIKEVTENSSAAKDGKTLRLRKNLKYLNACSFLIITLRGSGLFVSP